MTAALARTTLALPGELHAQGLALPADLPFEAWMVAFGQADLYDQASPWVLADLLVFGEDAYGEDHAAVLPTLEEDPTGERQARLKQAAWMGRVWPRSTRVPHASFTHHRLVAKLAQKDRQEAVGLLMVAVAQGWSTRDLAAEVDARRRAIPAESGEPPVCAADAPLTIDDLLPEWRDRAEASGQPFGYLRALIDTQQEATFLPGRWID